MASAKPMSMTASIAQPSVRPRGQARLIRADAAPEALSRVGKVPHAAHAVFRGVGGDQNEPRVARPRRRAGRLLADGQPARLLGKADEIQKAYPPLTISLSSSS